MTSFKWMAFGCRHAPLTDPAAQQWLIEKIRHEKPKVLVDLGDGIESNASSQWDDAKEIDIQLKDEFDADTKFMAEARKAAGPNVECVRLAGNHEDNIFRKGRIDKRIRSLCDWTQPGNDEFKQWKVVKDYLYCRRRGCYWLTNQVCLSHGYETSDGRIKHESMYFLQNAPFGLYVTAHTHRPERVSQVKWGQLPMSRYYANVGCLRDMSPDFMARKPKWNWGHACAVGEAMPLKSPRMAREWDCNIEVRAMYDDQS